VVYFNDTFSIPDDGSDIGSKYTRKPQLLNMAINSWLSTVVGEARCRNTPQRQGCHTAAVMSRSLGLHLQTCLCVSCTAGPDASAELLAVGALPKKAYPLLLDWTPVLGPVLACWLLQFLLPVL
jgi:hypothetical protein